MTNKKPKIAITMGDAAGIGPEIIVGAWPEILRVCEPVLLGHPVIFRRAAELLRLPALPDGVIEQCVEDAIEHVPAGVVDARAGDAAYRCLIRAIDLALAGEVGAIVTAPLNKEALHRAGHHYPGHTEILAERCGVGEFGMMLYLGPGENIAGQYGLAVDHVTLHCPMRSVFDQITVAGVLEKIRLVDRFVRKLSGAPTPPCSNVAPPCPVPVISGLPGDRRDAPPCPAPPRIGICSLNPHAGEGGLFGREEIEVIRPAVEVARSEGMRVEGPCPADTIMVAAKNGDYDAVVAMFHDQGHIALKLLGMNRAVNITLGLPIIRTSVAHGTAFDKAWQGIASPGSMIEAVRVAARLSVSTAGRPLDFPSTGD